MSFTTKTLRFTFVLNGAAVFPNTQANTLVISGLKASVRAKGTSLPAFPEANATIYGMKQADMVALSAFGFDPLGLKPATMTIEADSGDGRGFSTVFQGQLVTAGPDYSEAPAVKMVIFARVLAYESLLAVPPSAYAGNVDVATAIQNIVNQLNASGVKFVLENNNVRAQLSNGYFPNTLAQQLRTIAYHAGIDIYVEGNIVAICPKGAPRGLPVFTITPTSGLVGYPRPDYTQRGYVDVRSVFNPGFRFGGPIIVDGSQVVPANGRFAIGVLTNTLESVTPNGAWFSDMTLFPPGLFPQVS